MVGSFLDDTTHVYIYMAGSFLDDTTHVYIYMAGSFLAGYMHFNKILQKNKKISLHLKAYCIHRYALVNCIGNEEVKTCSNTKMSTF